jgi:DNA-binding NarL/FixJ family response regulator
MLQQAEAVSMPWFQDEAKQLMRNLNRPERDVVVLLSKGLSIREVGAFLDMPMNTAADHRRNAFRKLDVHTAVEAAVVATKAGLV